MVYRRNPAPCRLVRYIRIPGLPLNFEGDSNSVRELHEKIGLIDVGDDLQFVGNVELHVVVARIAGDDMPLRQHLKLHRGGLLP